MSENTEKTEVTIPQSAFVPCPMKTFKNRSVSKCPECEHFKGFLEVSERELDFERKYRVVCIHPIARSMTSVDLE